MITVDVHVVRPGAGSVRDLVDWAASDCPEGAPVLSIGAGEDWSGSLRSLRKRSPYLVGVDPDAAIERNRSLAERHRMSLEEFAASEPDRRFEVALAVYVLEHVAEPDAFVAACAQLLEDGGRLFAVTPSVGHYFGATTWALSRLGWADPVARRLTRHHHQHSHRHAHAHTHFRTEYRLNSVRTISRKLEQAGFRSVEFRCYDDTARYQWYLPPGLKWSAAVWSRLVYAVGAHQLMGHLSFRAVR